MSMPDALAYGQLREMLQNIPPVPGYELRCHPDVIEVMRIAFGPPPPAWPAGFFPWHPSGCDIFIDDMMLPGQYRLLRDGEVVMEGQIMTENPPEGLR